MKRVRPECWFVVAAMGMGLLVAIPGGCRRDRVDAAAGPRAIDQAPIPEFSEEVQIVLQRRIQVIEQLAAEQLLVDAVRQANRDGASRSDGEIGRLDRQWQDGAALSGLVDALTTNKCAKRLLEFQTAHSGFPEIFVSDARGLIVAATNRTTDYLQSDESWWQEAYSEGQGKSHHGELEYDTSVFSESISLNVPVLDPGSGKAIGVVKAVCAIAAIQTEL